MTKKDPTAQEDGHVMRNRDEAMRIFEASNKVKGVFCGHCHNGDFAIHANIPYLTFASLCVYEHETCAIVTINDKIVNVEGYGLNKSRIYPLRKKA